MATRRFLLLALTPKGWGETAFGIHLARGLREGGHDVAFLTRESASPLFIEESFTHDVIPESMCELLPTFVDGLVEEIRPHAIVLCDIATTERAFRLVDADPLAILKYGCPVVGVDTWDGATAGSRVDLFFEGGLHAEAWVEELSARIHPVPFLRPTSRHACQFLPKRVEARSHVRRHVRREMGIGAGEKLVLFCTAAWQHAAYDSEDGQRIAQQVPVLLASLIAATEREIHVAHVGPASFDLQRILGDRYHWLPPQAPSILDLMMAASDLVLSTNISAATVAKAVVSEIPVMFVANSVRASNDVEVEQQLGIELVPEVETWLRHALPIYPFTLWPLGFHEYLEPILRENPYMDVVRRVELCDGSAIRKAFEDLLFVRASSDRLRERQHAFVSQVQDLPTAAQVLLESL